MKKKIRFIKASAILQHGSERNRWAYAARELRTAQTALLRREHKRCLDDLEGSAYLYGWVTDSGRPLGIGHCAKSQGRQGERVCRIELPIPVSGIQLQGEAEGHLRKMDRQAKRKSNAAAAKRRSQLKVVKAA